MWLCLVWHETTCLSLFLLPPISRIPNLKAIWHLSDITTFLCWFSPSLRLSAWGIVPSPTIHVQLLFGQRYRPRKSSNLDSETPSTPFIWARRMSLINNLDERRLCSQLDDCRWASPLHDRIDSEATLLTHVSPCRTKYKTLWSSPVTELLFDHPTLENDSAGHVNNTLP